MKSSERSEGEAAPRSGRLGYLLVTLVAVVLIGLERSGLSARYAKLRVRADDYLLPDPNLTLVASLGYRSAAADFIFGHVLAAYGLHFQEHRLFEHVGEYLDVINLLDPKFRDPYRYADTLLTLQPQSPPQAFYRKARRVLDRGLHEFPYDQELWTTAGQFMAYLAPNSLKDEAEREEFRRIGTQYLVHACDLIGSNRNLPFHCITAANLLTKQGDREAAKRSLRRLLAMSDDEELQDLAQRKLRALSDAESVERSKAQERRYRAIALRDGMLFVSRVELEALGPATDTVACAGYESEAADGCASSWRRLAEHDQPSEAAP